MNPKRRKKIRNRHILGGCEKYTMRGIGGAKGGKGGQRGALGKTGLGGIGRHWGALGGIGRLALWRALGGIGVQRRKPISGRYGCLSGCLGCAMGLKKDGRHNPHGSNSQSTGIQ